MEPKHMFMTDAFACHTAERLFRRFDIDGSRHLDHREFARLTQSLLPNVRPAQVRELFHALDLNRDGRVSLDELEVWWPTQESMSDSAQFVLPALAVMELRVHYEERRYLELVTSLFFRDLPETSPELTARWEALVNGRLAEAERLRQGILRARIHANPWPEAVVASLKRAYRRLLKLETQERGLFGQLFEEVTDAVSPATWSGGEASEPSLTR